MINLILKNITCISEDDNLNTENYLASLQYLDNIYKLIIIFQKFISLKDITFLPSFKDKNLIEKLGIICSEAENELRYFEIKSNLFLGQNENVNKMIKECEKICDSVTKNDDKIIMILKKE